MVARHFGLLAIAVSVAVAAITACAGPPAGLISFTEGTASSEQNATEANDDNDDDPPAAGPVNAVFQSKVYASVQGTCESCHLAGTGGAPIFFGEDLAATYALFKQKGYDEPNNAFLNKPVHNGPALTDAQKGLLNEWILAEGVRAGTVDGG